MTSSAILTAFLAALFGSPTVPPVVSIADGPHGSERYAAVAARLGIRIVEARGPGSRPGVTVRWTAANPGRYAEVARRLAIQLDRFPPSLARAAGWKELILCGGLTLDGKAAGGLTSGGTIWINLDVGAHARAALTLHHEFFHTLELELVRSGRMSAGNPANWGEIAPESDYLPGGAVGQLDAIERWMKDRPRGFISAYAASAPIEDRAEVYASLVYLPHKTARLAAADPIVRRKVDRIRDFTREVCPDLPADFWANPDPEVAGLDR